jgi:hypothetical protein
VDHPRDLLADFLAIYHLRPAEIRELSGPEYLGLAYRLPMYAGTMRVRAEQANRSETRNFRHHDATIVKSEQKEIERDPLLADLIEFA